MTTWKRALLALVTAAGTALPARAQQSTTYDLGEHTVNSGGNPANGTVPQSASFRLSLDAIGDPVSLPTLGSASFAMDAGFVPAYPPPAEVKNLRFTSATDLAWDPEKSVGAYDVYRGLVSALPGDFGSCLLPNLPSSQGTDAATPAPGQCFFYLVTAENRIGEEGTKGYPSSGAERPNPNPCP